ncbi:MAG: hypothetical protein ACKO7Q_06850 [Actinomycetota bacterium]
MTPDELADGLLAGTLPRSEWTHAGHVRATHALVCRLGPDEALVAVRAAIPRLNEAHGVANSDTGGYHETLTVLYASAVADAVARGCDADRAVAEVGRDLPDGLWSRTLIEAPRARRAWVEPDLARPAFPLLGA